MSMLKPKLKLKPISDAKESEMSEAAGKLNKQRKSPLTMEKDISVKKKAGYR